MVKKMNEGKKHTTVQWIMMVFAVSVLLLAITSGYFSERTRERIERGVCCLYGKL